MMKSNSKVFRYDLKNSNPYGLGTCEGLESSKLDGINLMINYNYTNEVRIGEVRNYATNIKGYEELVARGAYLTHHIDNIPDKATYLDVLAIKGNRVVVDWEPSAGKTTAIRQFIVHSLITESNKSGVLCTLLQKDVDSIYYDIIAQLKYLHLTKLVKKDYSNEVTRYHTALNQKDFSLESKCDYKPNTVAYSIKKKWIVTTHSRTLRETSLSKYVSPSMYKKFKNDINNRKRLDLNNYSVVRDYLFIDECPSVLHKTFMYSETPQVNLLNVLTGVVSYDGRGYSKDEDYFNELELKIKVKDSKLRNKVRRAYLLKRYYKLVELSKMDRKGMTKRDLLLMKKLDQFFKVLPRNTKVANLKDYSDMDQFELAIDFEKLFYYSNVTMEYYLSDTYLELLKDLNTVKVDFDEVIDDEVISDSDDLDFDDEFQEEVLEQPVVDESYNIEEVDGDNGYFYDDNGLLPSDVNHTVSELPYTNIYIFDGTGDILFEGSTKWDVLKSSSFKRVLNLKSEVQLINSTVTRKGVPESLIVRQSADHLVRIAEENPNSKILVYTWKYGKTYRNSESHLPELIQAELPEDVLKRVEFIYYMSGKERVTSEYSDTDVAVVLGSFHIPRKAITKFNEVNSTRINTKDHTHSLMIQLIYRTAARLGKPIKLYVTDDYSATYMTQLLNRFNKVTLKGLEVLKSGYKDLVVSSEAAPITRVVCEQLIDHVNQVGEIYSDAKGYYVVYSKSDLERIYGIKVSSNNSMRNKLMKLGATHEYILGKPSKFKFYIESSEVKTCKLMEGQPKLKRNKRKAINHNGVKVPTEVFFDLKDYYDKLTNQFKETRPNITVLSDRLVMDVDSKELKSLFNEPKFNLSKLKDISKTLAEVIQELSWSYLGKGRHRFVYSLPTTTQ